MKCQNCGFESETNFCPMCGAQITMQPSASAQYGDYNTNPQSNPYSQSAPQYQQNIPNNPYSQNIPPYQAKPYNNAAPENTPFVQPNSQNSSPSQPDLQYANPYSAPFTNNSQTTTPNNPVNFQPAPQPLKKKNKATGGIVIACIICAVVLTGTVIYSFSCIAGNIEETEKKMSFDYQPDYTDYHTGDEASTSYGSIALKSMEKGEFYTESDDSVIYYNESYLSENFSQQYKITFLVTNDTDKDITVNSEDFSVSYTYNNSTSLCTEISDNDHKYPNEITVKSGESKEFSIFYYVADEAFNLITSYNSYDEDENCRYSYNFLDNIEYMLCDDTVSVTDFPQYTSFGGIALKNVDENTADIKEKGNFKNCKFYDITFEINNETSREITVSSIDLGIFGNGEKGTKTNASDIYFEQAKIHTIPAYSSADITFTYAVPKGNDIIAYYKVNNHITNPEEAVNDTNYNIYWYRSVSEQPTTEQSKINTTT